MNLCINSHLIYAEKCRIILDFDLDAILLIYHSYDRVRLGRVYDMECRTGVP